MSISIFDQVVSNFLKKYQIKQVGIEDAQQATKFHIESSKKSNTLWALIKDDYETLYSDYYPRIKIAIQDGLSIVFVDRETGEIQYQFIQIDAYTFLEQKLDQLPFPRNSNMLKFQSTLTQKLEQNFIKPEQVTARGSLMIQLYVSINPKIASTGWPSLINLIVESHLKDLGYMMTIGRFTNNIATIFYNKDQGKIMNEIQYRTEFGEEVPVIWFVRQSLKESPTIKELLIQKQKEINQLKQEDIFGTEKLKPKL